MKLPVRHRPGSLLEGSLPGFRKPIVTEFEGMFARMNRLLQGAASAPAALVWPPAAVMRETDQAYVIEAELSGSKRDDIDVEMSERELRITGEYKDRHQAGRGQRDPARRRADRHGAQSTGHRGRGTSRSPGPDPARCVP